MKDFNFPPNEDELFYKKYHAAAQTPQALREFLNSINKKDAQRRRLIIPELFPNQMHAILHKHSDFEIFYVFEGQCNFNVGFESLRLKRGDLIITAPEILHTVEAFDDESIIFEINLRHENFYEMFAPLVRGSHVVNKFFAEGLHGKSSIKYLLFHTAEDEFTRKNSRNNLISRSRIVRGSSKRQRAAASSNEKNFAAQSDEISFDEYKSGRGRKKKNSA